MGLFAAPFVVAQAHKMVPPEERGGFAAHKLIDAVEAAIEFDFQRGLAREARLFDELVRSAPSAALRHVFFAERELGKIPGSLRRRQPLADRDGRRRRRRHDGHGDRDRVRAGRHPGRRRRARRRADRNAPSRWSSACSRIKCSAARMTQEEAWQRGQSIALHRRCSELADADIVVEAVFENIDVKKRRLRASSTRSAKPDAILASNTSTLDIDAMAAMTKRPGERHRPALLRAGEHHEAARDRARRATRRRRRSRPRSRSRKTLRKSRVLSGNAFGFIGNRMFFDYAREAIALAEEGVPPRRVDA